MKVMAMAKTMNWEKIKTVKAKILSLIATLLTLLENAILKLKKVKELFGKAEKTADLPSETKSAPADIQAEADVVAVETVEEAVGEEAKEDMAEEAKKRRIRHVSNRAKLASAKKSKSKK